MTPRKYVAARMRRFAHRLDPIRPRWNDGEFNGIERYEQAWLVIETDGSPQSTTVKINGKAVYNCTALSFRMDCESLATATLELADVPVHFSGHMQADPDRIEA